MNLKMVDMAIKGYGDKLDEGDRARLDFFRVLWGVQDECMDLVETEYEAPAAKDVMDTLKAEHPVLSEYPVTIDEGALVETLDKLTQAVAESGVFPAEVMEAFDRVKWDRVVKASTPSMAGKNPSAWLENFAQVLVDDGMTEEVAHLGALLGSMALKVQLEVPAALIMEEVKMAGKMSEHPLLCPVCGSAPSLAHVGGNTSSSGRGRLLVCPQCAAAWEFERVRCARCGTHDQQKLHFFNVENDDAHRLATCDECGGYIRTLFSEDSLIPVSYEVEDVLMARLDAIAQEWS